MIVLIPHQIDEGVVDPIQEPENEGVESSEAEITTSGVLSPVIAVTGIFSEIVGAIVSTILIVLVVLPVSPRLFTLM